MGSDAHALEMIQELSHVAKHVLADAEAEAASDGKPLVLDDHVLRALARLPAGAESPRSRELFDRLRSSQAMLRLPPPNGPSVPPERLYGEGLAVRYNPAVLSALAEAWRYAVMLMQLPPGPEHLLLGLLWNTGTTATLIAAKIDLTFQEAFEQISGWSAPLPGFEPRPPLRSPTGERVEFPYEKLGLALRRLVDLLPEDAPRSFNHDRKIAWIRVDQGFEHLVQEAVEGTPKPKS